mmetsp:Transcript_15850/g.42765  ORF Transcript_15850/g.42765 Transcript_15850/m.42765 type:complete len:521 (+) Transcript_15850:890-2452(+)
MDDLQPEGHLLGNPELVLIDAVAGEDPLEGVIEDLLKGLDLLAPRLLTDIKVFHEVIAFRVQLAVVLGQALEFHDGVLVVGLGVHFVLSGIHFGLRLLDDFLLQRRHGVICIGDELLVGGLCRTLGFLGLRTELSGVVDKLFDHLHDALGPFVRCVLLLGHRRGLPGGAATLALLQKIVVRSQAVQRLLEDLNGHGLISHCLLEFDVLCFSVLCGTLQLELQLRDLLLCIEDALFQGLDFGLELSDFGLEVGLEVLLLCSRHLVLVNLGLAPIVFLDLVGLLCPEHGYHVVNRLLYLGERVQLNRRRQDRQLRTVRSPSDLAQCLRGLFAAVALVARVNLNEPLESAAHGVAGLVPLENFDRLSHSLHLSQPGVLALVEVRASLCASLLQIFQILLVLSEDLVLLTDVLLCLRQVVVRDGKLILLLLRHLLTFGYLLALRGPELCEGSSPGLFPLLCLRQVALHLLLQLLKDPDDLSALRVVTGKVAGALVRLNESSCGAHRTLHHGGVLRRPAGRGCLL